MIEIKSKTGKLLKTIDAADLRSADLRSANLYGAKLYGAKLRGGVIDGETITQQPFTIGSLHWFVLITDNYMRIGCQRHTHDEWRTFTDEHINQMDYAALDFWTRYKTMLLGICDSMEGGVK